MEKSLESSTDDSGSEAEEESMAKSIAANVQRNRTFWAVIKKELGIDPPLYLKHLLSCLGFDSAAALKNISSESLLEMEKFAQTDMLELLGEDNYTKSDFFGIYSNKPGLFRILPGHEVCLLEIKQHIIEKGLSHFATAEQDIEEKSTNIRAKKLEIPKARTKSVSAKKLQPQLQVESQDLLSEEDQLYKLLKTWFSKQTNGEDTFRDYLENPKNRYIQVSVNLQVGARLFCNGSSTFQTSIRRRAST